MSRPDKNLLSSLGLAKRAGRLVWGLDTVEAEDRIYLILLADDAGSSVKRSAGHTSCNKGVPLKILPFNKETLGRAIGVPLCAVAALTDKGFAGMIDGYLVNYDTKNKTASHP